MKFVEAISQKNDAPALLKLLCKVDDIKLPILVGEDLVGCVFESSKIEDTEELPSLLIVKLGRAEMREELVGVDRALVVPILGNLPRKNLSGQLRIGILYTHMEKIFGSSLGCHAPRGSLYGRLSNDTVRLGGSAGSEHLLWGVLRDAWRKRSDGRTVGCCRGPEDIAGSGD